MTGLWFLYNVGVVGGYIVEYSPVDDGWIIFTAMILIQVFP